MPTQGREAHRLRRGVRRRTDDADATRERGAPCPPLILRLTDGEATRAPADATVAGTREAADRRDQMSLVVYPQPTPEAISELAAAWDLHPVLVEDLMHGHQRPKLERYGDVVFLVARSAWYVDETEEVQFAEFHILVRPNAVVVLCQDWCWIDGSDVFVRLGSGGSSHRGLQRLLGDRDLLRLGPEAVAYRLLDGIVDGYGPVLEGLAVDQEQIERQVFGGEPTVTERIYRLSQEVIDLSHACSPLKVAMAALHQDAGAQTIAPGLRTYLNDVSDHLTRLDAEVSEMRVALAQILDVNATLVAQRQNEDMKKISGWAAILFSPTLVAAIYGMNFDVMPELHWVIGYPLALAVMAGLAVGLYRMFKSRDWM